MEEGNLVPRFFITVEPNDVLMGRGAPIIYNEGNVRFRKIVAERQNEYKASCRHKFKDTIAKEVIDEIVHKRNGRFLRVADDLEELKEKGYIPNDAKSAWVYADNMVILQKVKQALRELDDTPISTTSSTEKKRKKTNSPPTSSSTITSTSKRERNEAKAEDINVFIESNEDLNKMKPLKALSKEWTTTSTLAMKSELDSSQDHGEGYELDPLDTSIGTIFSLEQHCIQLDTFQKMSPVNRIHPSELIVTNNEQKNEHYLRLDQPSIRTNNLREGKVTKDPVQETRRIEQRRQQRILFNQMHVRQSELFHDELMNIKNILQEDQSNEPLHDQNQLKFLFPKVVDKSITNKNIECAHQIDYFQRKMSLIPDQSRNVMALKKQGSIDQKSLGSADRLLLRRQRFLDFQKQEQQKLMLMLHQLEQKEEQHQLLPMDLRNSSNREVMRTLSSWHQDVDRMSNTTYLESDLHLNNPHQQSQSYRNNTHNAYGTLETLECNDMNQYQLQLQQQEYVASFTPSEYVPSSFSTQEKHSFNKRNDFSVVQQQSIQQDLMSIHFTNQMYSNRDKNYQNYLCQRPDSANDRIMAPSIDTNEFDSYLNEDSIR